MTGIQPQLSGYASSTQPGGPHVPTQHAGIVVSPPDNKTVALLRLPGPGLQETGPWLVLGHLDNPTDAIALQDAVSLGLYGNRRATILPPASYSVMEVMMALLRAREHNQNHTHIKPLMIVNAVQHAVDGKARTSPGLLSEACAVARTFLVQHLELHSQPAQQGQMVQERPMASAGSDQQFNTVAGTVQGQQDPPQPLALLKILAALRSRQLPSQLDASETVPDGALLSGDLTLLHLPLAANGRAALGAPHPHRYSLPRIHQLSLPIRPVTSHDIVAAPVSEPIPPVASQQLQLYQPGRQLSRSGSPQVFCAGAATPQPGPSAKPASARAPLQPLFCNHTAGTPSQSLALAHTNGVMMRQPAEDEPRLVTLAASCKAADQGLPTSFHHNPGRQRLTATASAAAELSLVTSAAADVTAAACSVPAAPANQPSSAAGSTALVAPCLTTAASAGATERADGNTPRQSNGEHVPRPVAPGQRKATAGREVGATLLPRQSREERPARDRSKPLRYRSTEDDNRGNTKASTAAVGAVAYEQLAYRSGDEENGLRLNDIFNSNLGAGPSGAATHKPGLPLGVRRLSSTPPTWAASVELRAWDGTRSISLLVGRYSRKFQAARTYDLATAGLGRGRTSCLNNDAATLTLSEVEAVFHQLVDENPTQLRSKMLSAALQRAAEHGVQNDLPPEHFFNSAGIGGATEPLLDACVTGLEMDGVFGEGHGGASSAIAASVAAAVAGGAAAAGAEAAAAERTTAMGMDQESDRVRAQLAVVEGIRLYLVVDQAPKPNRQFLIAHVQVVPVVELHLSVGADSSPAAHVSVPTEQCPAADQPQTREREAAESLLLFGHTTLGHMPVTLPGVPNLPMYLGIEARDGPRRSSRKRVQEKDLGEDNSKAVMGSGYDMVAPHKHAAMVQALESTLLRMHSENGAVVEQALLNLVQRHPSLQPSACVPDPRSCGTKPSVPRAYNLRSSSDGGVGASTGPWTSRVKKAASTLRPGSAMRPGGRQGEGDRGKGGSGGEAQLNPSTKRRRSERQRATITSAWLRRVLTGLIYTDYGQRPTSLGPAPHTLPSYTRCLEYTGNEEQPAYEPQPPGAAHPAVPVCDELDELEMWEVPENYYHLLEAQQDQGQPEPRWLQESGRHHEGDQQLLGGLCDQENLPQSQE